MYLKYYHSDSCMSDDMDQVLEALYIRPCTWSDVFSFSGENCQLRDVDLSKMEEKRAVARKWSAWPGRGPDFAFILGQLAPLHHAPCTMHHALLGQLAPRATCRSAIWNKLGGTATASVHFLGPRFFSWSFPSILVINVFHFLAYW